MKEIIKSVSRFVELSREFTTNADEVYEGFEEVRPGHFSISAGTSYISGQVQYSSISFTPLPSKLEQYEQHIQNKYEKAKRYEEYLELQKTLTEYFNSVDKLNK